MKALLAFTVVLSLSVPVLIAGDTKAGAQAKADAPCCEKAKATECSKAKDSCCAKEAAALRQALLTHKGAYIARR